MRTILIQNEVKEHFFKVRNQTERICIPLQTEDYIPQPTPDVSPPKWHLAHSTWFFEQFVLSEFSKNYKVFRPEFSFLFNSYYKEVGTHFPRNQRGYMTRPTVKEVYEYRTHLNLAMDQFFELSLDQHILHRIELGINHEQQHQELMIYDIKYILGLQFLQPKYGHFYIHKDEPNPSEWIHLKSGEYSIGADDKKFHFDNESPEHKVFIKEFLISNRLVTNQEFVEFIEDKGYKKSRYWHSEGFDFITSNQIFMPLYWTKEDNKYYTYNLYGKDQIRPNEPVSHISFFEAFAFAEWKGARLPTEEEWEIAYDQLNVGSLWEWTSSSYSPYPGFKKETGAIGEYNGKFMVNQYVLRGSSIATPERHSRKSYRNFFPANARLIFSGIRLANNT